MDTEHKLYEITREKQINTTLIVWENLNDIMKDIEKMKQKDDLEIKKIEVLFDFVYISNNVIQRLTKR